MWTTLSFLSFYLVLYSFIWPEQMVVALVCDYSTRVRVCQNYHKRRGRVQSGEYDGWGEKWRAAGDDAARRILHSSFPQFSVCAVGCSSVGCWVGTCTVGTMPGPGMTSVGTVPLGVKMILSVSWSALALAWAMSSWT